MKMVKVNINNAEERATLEGDDSRVMMDRIIPFIENAVASNDPFLSVVWFHAPHEPFEAVQHTKPCILITVKTNKITLDV